MHENPPSNSRQRSRAAEASEETIERVHAAIEASDTKGLSMGEIVTECDIEREEAKSAVEYLRRKKKVERVGEWTKARYFALVPDEE